MSLRSRQCRLGATVTVTAAVMALAGCAAHAPAPQVQSAAVPAAWHARVPLAPQGPWTLARPGDSVDKGPWWQLFNDTTLNAFQEQALRDSPSLKAAASRVAQARALAAVSAGARWPKLDVGLREARTRTSSNRPGATSGAQALSSVQNDTVLSGSVSYEVDLFGRQSQEAQAALDNAEQAQADLLNARLVLSADLATYYFNARSADAEIHVVQQGLSAQTRASQLLSARHEGGVASQLDVAQQQALLDATRTQLTLLQKQRVQYEHALATLVGQPASTFALSTAPLPGRLPRVPVGLPSDILQRRPDVASAERVVAAAKSTLGAVHAAWFPSITLNASGGWEAKDIARLIEAPSLIWALGGGVAQTVFDGGRTQAREDQAQAALDVVSANYQQTVLRALQEVEDGLSSLTSLDVAHAQSEAAVRSAQRVLEIALDRYAGGLNTYLDVITAQQNALNNQRLSTQLRGQQLQATTYLIKALGGGWEPIALGPVAAALPQP